MTLKSFLILGLSPSVVFGTSGRRVDGRAMGEAFIFAQNGQIEMCDVSNTIEHRDAHAPLTSSLKSMVKNLIIDARINWIFGNSNGMICKILNYVGPL